MPRIVLAAVLLLLSGEAARADDFKTCASGAPDYAIMACTNLIEGGKLDTREQAIAYTNRAVAFRIRGGLQRALADLNRAIELDSRPRADLRQSWSCLSVHGRARSRARRLQPRDRARSQ